ncbi:glycosyltransferase family 4 protein [Patescibacteria group bacterium]|nr:glycosyltransferase family 4 protein [Patescibacteria group bacterium]MBU4453295.1 glycosyltransferase family 4 protein [Patescibacteria group bacterium]
MKCRTYGIDVNALARTQYTGVERYVFELITELIKKPLYKDERVFLYSSKVIKELGQLPYGWEWKILKLPIIPKGWTHLRLSLELLLNPPSVFFSPAHEIPLFSRRTKIVNTIHDIAFVHVPEVYTFCAQVRQHWAVKRSMKRSAHILAVSQTTKDDLLNQYSIDPVKITVTRLGVRLSDQKTVQKTKNHFFALGRVEKKKNIAFLIEVFEKFLEKNPGKDVKLVLGGKMGDGSNSICQRIEGSPAKNNIVILGYVSDERMRDLMAESIAYVFPSSYEGFGLPALEAMSHCAPVIASDIPALREVCDKAALFASPTDHQEWLDALDKVSNQDLRNELIRRGKERIKDFSWTDTAQKTLKVLRNV